jgi:chromosomal replication initiator protein
LEGQLHLGEDDALIAFRRAWEKALALLAPEINRPSFESFFKTAKPLSIQGNTAAIGAASELSKIFLEKYADHVKVALGSILGFDVDVAFTIMPKEPPKAKAAEVKEPPAKTGSVSQFSLPLNDKYTFTSFIVGPCNRLAHAAAQSLAQKPGRVYNPFFLYGGPGLGKTHLLQAIGHYILENHPKLRIAYVSGEMFTSQYVTSIREHRSEDFRQRYRGIDVWLVDDVQFLAGKERTKEEFFHTFNALIQINKQIILSSDRSPRDLAPLEERLKSRFESGLVVDIAPPDLETRIAILESKTIAEKVEIKYPILECIAGLIPTNIRALEGALVTLLAYSSLMKTPLTIPLAQEILGRYLAEKKYTELTPEAVQRAVAQEFGMEIEELRNQKRTKELALARHVAMYLTRELTGYSLQAIGKAYGGRNHASVIHAHSRIKELLDEDPNLRAKVEELREDLRTGRV